MASDNVFFGLTGPGTNITGVGGTICQDSWCNVGVFFSPGTRIYPNIGQIFIANFNNATVGGKSYNPATDIAFTSGFAIDVLGNLTLPTNSQSSAFSACVPATMSGPIGGFVMNGDTPALISLTTPTGGSFCTTWNLTDFGQYQFARGQFVASTVPEPGTFGLMGSGVAALFGAALRRRYKNNPKWR